MELRTEIAVQAFEEGNVVMRAGTDDVTRIAADSVIVSTPIGPDRRVATELVAANIAFHEVGDCRRFGLIEGAFLDVADLVDGL